MGSLQAVTMVGQGTDYVQISAIEYKEDEKERSCLLLLIIHPPLDDRYLLPAIQATITAELMEGLVSETTASTYRDRSEHCQKASTWV